MNNYSGTTYCHASCSATFDVTDVSTHKVKFISVVQDNCTWGAHATIPSTMFQFVRLGDT